MMKGKVTTVLASQVKAGDLVLDPPTGILREVEVVEREKSILTFRYAQTSYGFICGDERPIHIKRKVRKC